jgi:hypothetical protein
MDGGVTTHLAISSLIKSSFIIMVLGTMLLLPAIPHDTTHTMRYVLQPEPVIPHDTTHPIRCVLQQETVPYDYYFDFILFQLSRKRIASKDGSHCLEA